MERSFEIRPLGARILVELIAPETKTASGLIIPETHKHNQNKARILALGDGILLSQGTWLPWPYAIGDTVLLSRYAGIEVGDNELIVSAEDVIGVISG